MTIAQIFAWGGGVLIVLMSLVQISPIKIDPWSFLLRCLGRAINAEVLKELEEVKAKQTTAEEKLEAHIKKDDEREIDHTRDDILRFNVELIRHEEHTWEAFTEVLRKIDVYERYCSDHPKYSNGRCVHAIENINRVYSNLMETGGFAAM